MSQSHYGSIKIIKNFISSCVYTGLNPTMVRLKWCSFSFTTRNGRGLNPTMVRLKLLRPLICCPAPRRLNPTMVRLK